MVRGPCYKNLNRRAWTAQEDLLLSEYIKVHGDCGWNSLPQKAGLKRCGKSCRLRWLNYLRPHIKRGNISQDEEELIIRLHRLLGNRWSLIAGRLPGRTDNEIKNYWNTHLSRKLANAESIAPNHQKINSIKSTSHLENLHIPLKTTDVRIAGVNESKSTPYPLSVNQAFRFPGDAAKNINTSKSWCELFVEELMADSDLEFVDSTTTINCVETESPSMQVIVQRPPFCMPSLIGHQFLHSQHSAENKVNTSKKTLFSNEMTSPHENLLLPSLDLAKNFGDQDLEGKLTNELN
ncbi:hypothetical protein SUGI_1002530 [Cryptomeria japonica]|uniref:transcription factor MYB3-like n=1 Tax=Cryptomeria japonica TaxID=3369 RepID=UPI002414B796|nr:transcription factor MYB3-like [Cryptomeria japonica]GLJ47493.1 hypothetical protein SUGI_1002530 [Cryptomeria japonica]